MGSKRRPAPSILFSVKEAKSHDAEAFAALALGGLSAAALLEPKLLAFQELFEGPLRERELRSLSRTVRRPRRPFKGRSC